MINEGKLASDLKDKVIDALKHSVRCWECGKEVRVDPRVESIYTPVRGLTKCPLHPECLSKFCNVLSVNTYDSYIPISFKYSIFESATILDDQLLIDADSSQQVIALSFNRFIGDIVSHAPYNIRIEDMTLTSRRLDHLAQVRLSVVSRYSPICFICNSDRVLYSQPVDFYESGDLLSQATIPMEQNLYMLPDERHYFHKSCMTNLVNNLIINAY
jgi:hypothetical protein